jgi:hypothetical protein
MDEVQQLQTALDELKRSGEYQRIVSRQFVAASTKELARK